MIPMMGPIGILGRAYNIKHAALLDGSTGHLSRTPVAAGSRQKMKGCVWINTTKLQDGVIYGAANTSPDMIRILATGRLRFLLNGGDDGFLDSNEVLRDGTAFGPLYWELDTATQTFTAKFSGLDLTFTTTVPITLNYNAGFSSDVLHTIGKNPSSANEFSPDYMAAFCVVNGDAIGYADVGENNFYKTDVLTGNLRAIAPTISDWGTAGFYLNCADKDDLGTDVSGNGNHWDVSETGVKQVTSTPTDVVAAWNKLIATVNNGRPTFDLGNKTLTGSSAYSHAEATLIFDTGKFIAATRLENGAVNLNNGLHLGYVLNARFDGGSGPAGQPGHIVGVDATSFVRRQPGNVNVFSSPPATDDWWVMLVDADAGHVWIGTYGSSAELLTWFPATNGGAVGDPALGTNPTFTFTPSGAPMTFRWCGYSTGAVATAAFAEAEMPFDLSSGFNALTTKNLPARNPKVPPSPQTDTVPCYGVADNVFINLGMAPDQSEVSTLDDMPIIWGVHATAHANGVKIINPALSGPVPYSIAVEAWMGGKNVSPANAQPNPG